MRRLSGHRRRGAAGAEGDLLRHERSAPMKPFDYTAPQSVDDAVRAASAPNTRFIAGGTNLIDLLKIEVETPAHLVDLNPLAESDRSLRSVGDAPGGGLRIGALTPMSDAAWDPRVKERY